MRPPDFIIGSLDRPYLLRWWIIPRNRWFNIYLHQILRDDDDRALHDHPWWNVSIVLRGGYEEVTPRGRFWREPGSIVFRRATAAHRLVLPVRGCGIRFCWSLFITGPRIREWGFHCRAAGLCGATSSTTATPDKLAGGATVSADGQLALSLGLVDELPPGPSAGDRWISAEVRLPPPGRTLLTLDHREPGLRSRLARWHAYGYWESREWRGTVVVTHWLESPWSAGTSR